MDPKPLFKEYLKNLTETSLRGDAREESFYSDLENLLSQAAQASERKHVRVTTLPRPTEGGNPDFRLWNGQDRIIGYIEAKKPAVENLDAVEESEQLRRYRATFPNLILTNFLEFRLYRNGERIRTALLARPVVLNRVRTVPPLENADQLWALLEHFLDFSLPQTFTAESLAIELAKRTRFLRNIVVEQLTHERPSHDQLFGFYQAFQEFLISSLSPEDFADLYAQTITYGLFAARTRAGEGFNRRAAFDNIPHTIGILRDLFRFISLGDLPAQLEWIVDDIAEVLAVADAPGILARYYRDGKGSDPIVHFYETFLARYDPEERERRGVYYTPEPVVDYIVRSLHLLLKHRFDKPDGLAARDVTLLDPAAGTMTFVARAARQAVAEFEGKYGSGARQVFIQDHILRNFYAFELMMAPYTVGHLKMAFYLEELGRRLNDDERVRFYLTNTLDMNEMDQTALPGLSSLAEESHLAGEVKRQQPILVILGNPPYSGHSANQGNWIRNLIEDYKQVDGKPLGEKNPKWLQDDYVKFLRFAEWKIAQAGRGVVGMITNHSYLDNPTFRGMRRHLMQTFDEIYVLDLHGSALKRETTPDGSPDQNVFDIRQGVAVAFFIKTGKAGARSGRVYHAECWGQREEKYAWLQEHDWDNTDWQEIAPTPKFYLFVPWESQAFDQYKLYSSVKDIFSVNGVGMTTARDNFVIDLDHDKLVNRIRLFVHNKGNDNELHFLFNIRRKKGWNIRKAWNMLQGVDEQDLESLCVSVLYRPFDIRWIFYHDAVVWRTVKQVMRHMLAGENVALITARSNKSTSMDHFLCAQYIVETKCGESTTQSYTFPLYLYPDTQPRELFSFLQPQERQPNLNPRLVAALEKAWG
ncbi:MAG: N-6 DNA methylase, partial [Chloroflexi bacterium]|nr:N-6 DNA methylase [Chloroflexota bacterium]